MSDNDKYLRDAKEPGTREALADARRDFTADALRRKDLANSPMQQFQSWMHDAREHKLIDATAMAVCTVDKNARPHSRMLLLKQTTATGFVWFSNYDSHKGQDLAGNSAACLLFFWRELERQVRIEGTVRKLETAEADAYFQSRPAGSRYSAAASVQSSPVANRAVLENKVRELKTEFPQDDVPRPPSWGGYELTPSRYEFWQGRADRLHDRFVFQQQTEPSDWRIERLSP